MAHAAKLDKLTDGLVASLTSLTAQDSTYKAVRSQAARRLRDQSHAQTNQFAVKARLDGLIEKFAVLNREDLADALQSRLEQLSQSPAWTPEVLSLLLDLSDRPTSRTILSHVTSGNESSSQDLNLTWEDIIAEHPLEEPGIWDDVDRGYHSSADEHSDPEVESEHTVSTSVTSTDDEPSSAVRLHLTQPDESAVSLIREARQACQIVAGDEASIEISELAMVRELMLTLHGLTTNFFNLGANTGKVGIPHTLTLATASSTSVAHVLNNSAKTASAINYLRIWIRSSQPLLYLRAVQAAIGKLLTVFAFHLGALEKRYIDPYAETVVSVIDVSTAAHAAALPLVHLSSIVQVAALSFGSDQQLTLLDNLYDEACLAQLSGAETTFNALVSVFLAGLRAYLRPIATWTMSGNFNPSTHDVPFVIPAGKDCDASRLWREQFVKNTAKDGSVLLPKCMLAHADQLFALGKSRAFLQRLQPNLDDVATAADDSTFLPDWSQELPCNDFITFSHFLSDELSTWVARIGKDCTPLLLKSLWQEHNLGATISALPTVFFSGNGIAFRDFADAVVKRIVVKGKAKAWNDQFMLAELARSTIGICKGVQADCIQVNTPSGQVGNTFTSTTRTLVSFSLEYSFPWPIQNITGCTTSRVHAQIFAFMLQVYYASSFMTKNFFDLRSAQERSTPDLLLRQRLVWFTNTIHFFIATTAGTIHHDMSRSMSEAAGIDAMVSVWQEYEHRLETSLLLSPKLEPVRDAITGMLELSEIRARTTKTGSIIALQDQFDQSLSFLVAGLRGLSRAGGDMALEALADKLEWSPG